MTVKIRENIYNTEINPEMKDPQEITGSVMYSEYTSSYTISDKQYKKTWHTHEWIVVVIGIHSENLFTE